MIRQYQQVGDNSSYVGIATSRFDIIIERLLIILLAFMPLAFGVVHAWSEEVVIALSGAIGFCFLLKLAYHRNQTLVWSWCYLPIVIFLLLAVFQLVSLPTGLVTVISPNTAALKTELLSDLPNAETQLKSMSLSFYSNATKHDLRLLLAAATVFVVVLNVFRRPDQIKRLLMAITVIGAIVAVITFAQNFFGNGKIYWMIATKYGKGYSGPFVCHSHYGQFMNLSIGAAIALVIVHLHEHFAGKNTTPPDILGYLSSRSARKLWWLIAVICLGMTTVFITLTRGGMLSMLIAVAFTIIMLASKKALKGRSWVMVVMAILAFTCILYTGFDAMYDRLATLRNLDVYQDRWQILKDLTSSYKRFPVWGTGLGTHSVIYPMFQNINSTLLFTHAENEYAQVIEETGLVGFIALAIFGIITWASYAKNARNSTMPMCSAAYGLGFGLLAILIHSLSDFGQHLPANLFLSVIFCAILLRLARRATNPSHSPDMVASLQNPKRSRIVFFILLLAGSGVWGWGLVTANNARIAETHWNKVANIETGLMQRNWEGTDAEYTDLISNATKAAAWQPENVRYRYWLNVYRWRAISRNTDPETGAVIIPKDAMDTVHNIVEQCYQACSLCPTYGPTYSMAGQIDNFIFNNDTGAERIRRGFLLAPYDPLACLAAGRLDILEGKAEESLEKLRKAVELDKSLMPQVVALYVNHLSRPDLAILVAGDNIPKLDYVVGILDDMQYYDMAEQTRVKMIGLLEAQCAKPGAKASTFAYLAKTYERQMDKQAAIACYRRALTLEYGQVHWRLSLARLLAEDTEHSSEAIKQARVCLRLRPQFKAAQKLIMDLSVRPNILSKNNTVLSF